MAEHKYCTTCGQPLPGRVGYNTVRIAKADLDKLVPGAIRTPIPPPLETVIVEPDPDCPRCSTPPPLLPEPVGAETMPDAGWLKKHLRQQKQSLRKRVQPYLVGALILFYALLAYATCDR